MQATTGFLTSPAFVAVAAIASMISPGMTFLAMRRRVTRLEQKMDAILSLFLEREAPRMSPETARMLERVLGLPGRRWQDPKD